MLHPGQACFILTRSIGLFDCPASIGLLSHEAVLEHLSQLLEEVVLPCDLLVAALDGHTQLVHLLDYLVLPDSGWLIGLFELEEGQNLLIEVGGEEVWVNLLEPHLLKR